MKSDDKEETLDCVEELESREVALDLRSRKYLKDTHDDEDGIKEYDLIENFYIFVVPHCFLVSYSWAFLDFSNWIFYGRDW